MITFKKNPAAVKAVSYAQIDLKLQSWEIGSDHGERLVIKDVFKKIVPYLGLK